MTIANKHKLIKYLQGLHATYSIKVSNSISIGKCSNDILQRLIKSTFLIQIIYRYQVFDEKVTNARKIVVVRNDSENTSFSIIVGGLTIATYSGSGTANEIVAELAAKINATTSTHSYYATYNNDILYIYTYETTLDFTHITTFAPIVGETVLVESSLETSLSEILDLWNCLTLCELVNIKKYLETIIIQ